MNIRKNKRNMSAKTGGRHLLQWIILASVFFAATIIMLYSYSLKQKQIIDRNIRQNITANIQKYGEDISSNIKALVESGGLFCQLIEEPFSEDYMQDNTEYLQIMQKNLGVYKALLVNQNGQGIDQNGKDIQISEPYFSEISLDEDMVLYTEQDGIVGNEAIIASIPTKDKENLVLLYYDVELLAYKTGIDQYKGKSFDILADNNGKIIFANGKAGEKIKEEESDFYAFAQTVVLKEEYKTLKNATRSGRTSFVQAEIDNHIYYICSVPTEINKWYYSLAVSEDYVQSVRKGQWAPSRRLITNMVIAVGIFVVMIIVFNILNKRKFTDKSEVLEKKADTDLLTELNNKIATERKIKEYIEENPNSQSLLFVFDIDNFKKVNDTRGHAFGDEVLKSIGHRLKAEFRVSDIIGRVGGDEFILFLKNIKDDKLIEKESRRVEEVFKDFQVGQYSKYLVTASIGCAVFPKDADSFEALYKAADQGLYKAKRRGKNQLAFYNEGVDVPENVIDNGQESLK